MTRHGKGPATTSNPAESSSSGDLSSVTVDTSQQSGEASTSEVTFATEVVGQIEALVESFRTGKIKKPETIFKIGQVLASQSAGSERLKSDALERYASTLDGIEAISVESNRHGMHVTGGSLLGKRKDGTADGDRGYEQPDGDHPANSQSSNVDDFIRELSQGNELGEGGNADSYASDSGSDDGSEHASDGDSGDRGRSNKKQRVYESQMPWFKNEQRIRKSKTHRSCNKTRNILDTIQRDPVAVKRWIRCASSAPAGFPSTEWDAIIKGESVNLDTVFSSLHHVHCVDESIGRVGSTEIQFGRAKPAAKVETCGQWTAAFNLVIKATTFVFPHRNDELRQYEDYIEELFSAKSTSVHPKLFKYDEAVRFKVGQGQNMLLTDRDQFTRYYEAIVAPDGVGTGAASDGSKTVEKGDGKAGGKSDICHRFNGTNGCKSSAEKCKYKHICKKCKQSGHGKIQCKVVEGM
jgi:hypothetical protein